MKDESEEGGGESAAGLSCALRINQTIWGSITLNLPEHNTESAIK